MPWIALARLTLAFLLGALIGFERQLGKHPAGLRTSLLVTLGAALFVSVSVSLEHADPTRVAGQIASGIGFLGGGAILREGINVRGMNTAATLWCSAAIGTLCGLGFYFEAVFGTSLILVSNILLRPIVEYVDRLAAKYKNGGEP